MMDPKGWYAVMGELADLPLCNFSEEIGCFAEFDIFFIKNARRTVDQCVGNRAKNRLRIEPFFVGHRHRRKGKASALGR